MSNQDEKKKLVKKVEELLKGSPVVGIVNMHALPTAQLQRMREKLRGSVDLFLTKKRLIRFALENVKAEKKGIEGLEEFLKGIPALLLSNDNPFKVFSVLQKNKSKAAAKGGQIAPNDIKIPAGMTQFTPGPIISELGAFGLKTKVSDGKIEILEDAVVVKEGEEITQEIAGLLSKMGIEPMEIGLDLVAVYEAGQIYKKDVLAIDETEYANNFTQAQSWAFNLAVEAGIMTTETTELMIQKAAREVKALALEANILTDETKEEILAKAEAHGQAVGKDLNLPAKDAVKEDKPEEAKKEEPVKEDPKEEPAKEEKKEAVEEPKKEEAKEEAKVEDVKPEEVKEEPKPEAPVEEAKTEEKPVEEKKDETDEKVAGMVDAWKDKDKPKPTAEDIIKDAKE
ncbi:50S ribosomal protein L10 [Candidatus Woesearchaeota archaeon]|jgi:large subunit ribosomal protein L10|nr:50S ribosomal protein L10 [Candidatus Woesearchaeota archaeon]MBT4368152.1 50S ribosomal protein L10 [Candidatus Woesearchaeota archaeon]MBT4712640.1 50S ribosomal protein L10 [Candidatus Woesearchaeota archaeon]MBT6639553.1 50S ribosomal protein L10 [Candidatus Woesearchaeota archaeon]MBT7133725.1 50S ribosomal protein L10 [Candidatus Woesearchaeota archaeon]